MKLKIPSVVPKQKGTGKRNQHGIGGQLSGEPDRNPKGFIEGVPPALRYKFNAKPGEVRNPYGRKGYKGAGLTKMSENKRTPEGLKLALEHRELTEICRMKARDAIQKLEEIIDNEASADTAKLAAIGMLMDRAYGKATQTNVNAQVNADGKPTEIDDRELNSRIEAAIKRVEAITRGAAEEARRPPEPPDLRKLN